MFFITSFTVLTILTSAQGQYFLSLPSRQTDIRTLLHGVLNLLLPENKHVILTVHAFFIKKHIVLYCAAKSVLSSLLPSLSVLSVCLSLSRSVFARARVCVCVFVRACVCVRVRVRVWPPPIEL